MGKEGVTCFHEGGVLRVASNKPNQLAFDILCLGREGMERVERQVEIAVARFEVAAAVESAFNRPAGAFVDGEVSPVSALGGGRLWQIVSCQSSPGSLQGCRDRVRVETADWAGGTVRVDVPCP